jgi:hypothetical protein
MASMMRWMAGTFSLLLCCVGTLTLVASFELRVDGGRHRSFLPLYALAAIAFCLSLTLQWVAIRKATQK